MRSPLNAILGWNRLLRSRRGDDPQIARVTETVESSGQAQLRLIEDLLDTARIISGKMRMETQPVELVGVIASALDAVRPAADSKGIIIVPDFGLESGQMSYQINGDPDRLQQVVWNLVSNAIKFTSDGGRVWVGLRRGGPGVQIIVRDTGQGISPDLLPYVFDRFKQGDSSVAAFRRFRAWPSAGQAFRRTSRRQCDGGEPRRRPGRDLHRQPAGARRQGGRGGEESRRTGNGRCSAGAPRSATRIAQWRTRAG